MTDAAKKILIFAAGIMLVIGLVGIAFLIYNNSKTSINSSINQYSNLTSQYDNIIYSQYENSTAKGDEIVRLINNMTTTNDGVTISVKTKSATAAVTYAIKDNKIDPALTTAITDSNYINPNAVFDCTITRNDNGVITALTFTQK